MISRYRSVGFPGRDAEFGKQPEPQRDEVGVVTVPRPRQGDRRGVGNPPLAENENTIGERKCLIHVVRDQQHRRPMSGP